MALGPFILGAAGIQGATGLASGKKGASAATQAAQIQAQAQMAALQLEQQKYQITQGQVQPYVDYGTSGIPALQAFVSGPGTTPIDTSLPTFQPYQGGVFTPPAPFTFQPTMAQLQNVPGYQFQSQQARDAGLGQLIASGRGTGSAAIAGVTDLANQFAATNWKDYYNAMLQTYNTNYNAAQNAFTTNFGAGQQAYQTNVASLLSGRTMDLQQLQQIANILQGRVNTGASAIQTQAGLTAQLVPQMASAITGAGTAQASGVVGAANALTGGLQTVGSAAATGVQNYVGQQNLQQLYALNALGAGGNQSFNLPTYYGTPTGGDMGQVNMG